ncbi:unnamed protein product, partial [marine sediment metagenome]
GGAIDTTTGSVDSVTLVDTTTTNTDMVGTDGANTTTPPTVAAIRAEIDTNSTQLGLIVADTNELQVDDVPGLIAALNDVAATDIVSAGAITTLSGAVANVDLVDTTTTNTDMRGTNSANTVVPDAAGVAPTAVEIRTEIDSNSTQLTAIVADTNELQTDDVPTLIGALNDVAATDIVSAGAITTLTGAVVNVDLVDTTTTNTDMVGTDSAYTGTPPTVEAIADQVWDEVLTGGTHNVTDSGGKRLRDLQEFGTYEGGAIWIDTVNGAAGTTD